MELLYFIWKGRCGWYISTVNKFSVPGNYDGEKFVPYFGFHMGLEITEKYLFHCPRANSGGTCSFY
jgi:hypothetical protein